MSAAVIDAPEPASGEQRMILIETAGFGDAKFYAGWLSFAAKAENILVEIRKSDSEFRQKIEDLEGEYKLDFATAGALIVTHLGPEFPALAIDLYEECFYVDMFCIMAELGFYERTGDRYQMTLPVALGTTAVRQAVLKLANTMDEDEVAHPERLVVSLSGPQAKAWHRRLSEQSEAARLADREVLLGRRASFSNRRRASRFGD